MVGLKVKHGFYSAEADLSYGTCDYKTPDGRVVKVTAVYYSDTSSGGYFWHDVVYVGVVTECVASHKSHTLRDLSWARVLTQKSGYSILTKKTYKSDDVSTFKIPMAPVLKEDDASASWIPRISPKWQSFLGWDKFTKSPNRHFPYPMIRPQSQWILRLREPREEQHLILRLDSPSSPQRFETERELLLAWAEQIKQMIFY